MQNEYLRLAHHPAYRQMITNIRSHNEERGEMSLSLLAHSIVGDPDRGKVDKLDMNYSLMNKCRSLSKKMGQELSIDPPSRFQVNHSTTDDEVNIISQHMQEQITSMADGSWETYTPNLPAYTATSSTSTISTQRYLVRNASRNMLKSLQKIAHLLLFRNSSYVEYQHLFM